VKAPLPLTDINLTTGHNINQHPDNERNRLVVGGEFEGDAGRTLLKSILRVSLIGGAWCERSRLLIRALLSRFSRLGRWLIMKGVMMERRESMEMQWFLLNPDKGHSWLSQLNRKPKEVGR